MVQEEQTFVAIQGHVYLVWQTPLFYDKQLIIAKSVKHFFNLSCMNWSHDVYQGNVYSDLFVFICYIPKKNTKQLLDSMIIKTVTLIPERREY